MQMNKHITDRLKNTCSILFQKVWMHFHGNLVNTYFIHPIIIRSCSNAADRSHEIPSDIKCKEKISTVKISVSHNRQPVSVIQRKSASSVIKRLNWENLNLFGPIQVSKPVVRNKKKIEEQKIIQHTTHIPIIEPTVIPDSISETLSSLKSQSDELLNLDTILTFPLVNKSNSQNLSNKQISEFNILRKQLELLYKNSSAPSVSLILQKTMSAERLKILERWKENMIKKLGEDSFQMYQKKLLANGASLHSSINNFLSSTPESELQIKEENIGHWKSLKYVFPSIKDVKLLEEYVAHPFLCYKGIVDCFARYKNELVVIDWKTSKKSKLSIQSTYDNPLQIAAYIGALNFDPNFRYLICKGLIVIAYENGMPATVHFMDTNSVQQYWNEWLQRVKEFWKMKISETESL